MFESALIKIFPGYYFPYQAGRDKSPLLHFPSAPGQVTLSPLWHPCPAPTHSAPWGCLICLSSLHNFVFLLLWFSHCWYKQEQKSPVWLRLCLFWWELLVTSVRSEPSPPNTNPFKPGLALPLEISPRFCSIKPKMYQHIILAVFLKSLT